MLKVEMKPREKKVKTKYSSLIVRSVDNDRLACRCFNDHRTGPSAQR